jgi:hypothetical protein
MTVSHDFFCAEHSRQTDEQLFGTAPRVAVWLLLEYDGRWESDPLEGSHLPPVVQDRLRHTRDTLPNTRLGFIRQQPRLAPEGLAFFVALLHETQPLLYAFRLASYNDLLAIDIPAVAARDARYMDHIQPEPLVMVCTHGQRDKCCARYGQPAYQRLAELADSAVWQVSHVGGHRFAANVITVPQGVYYGRVDAEQATPLLHAHRAGELYLPTYRGRACYARPVQAAEYFLRAETGLTALDAFTLHDVTQVADAVWQVRFAATHADTLYTLRLDARDTPPAFYKNCDDSIPCSLAEFHLLALGAEG